MSKRSGWDHNLSVTANGKGLVGHAGAVLLRKCADRVGLSDALGEVMPVGQGPGWWDRGLVLVNLAVAVVLGAKGMSDIALLAHQRQVFGDPPSDSTVGRALAGLDETLLRRIAAVRARVRAHVWHLLALRPGGFPWLATWTPGPGYWACTTTPNSPTPNRTPCATGCGTCPPDWPATPAAAA